MLRSVWNDQDVCFVHIRVDEHKNSGLTNLPSYINVQLIRRSSPGGQRSISNSFITSRQVRASHLDVFQLITKKEIFLRSCSFPKEKFPPKKQTLIYAQIFCNSIIRSTCTILLKYWIDGEGLRESGGGGGKYTLWALFAMVRLEILRLCSIENSERTPRNLDYIHLESSLWQTDRSNAPPFRFTMTRGSGCHWKTWNLIAEVQITVLIIWRPEGVCVIYFSKLSE